MRNLSKIIWIVSIAAIIVVGIGLVLASGEKSHAAGSEMKVAPKPNDGAFIHLTHGRKDPHRVWMALQMAQHIANDKNKDVCVYLDIDAVEVVINKEKDIQFKDKLSAKTKIKRLLAARVPVYVCPGCLQVAGYTPEDVMPGVRIADKDGFFDFTEGRILTIDY
jgi:predicted peroxiredoxin